MSRQVSPTLQDSHATRYDRQIRVWGAEGQARLEAARVALLGCSATGAETLKNLVLGGIGAFTIVDGAVVTPRDTGNNFLLTSDVLGQPRAAAVTAHLQEMNDAVASSYVQDELSALLESRPDFLAGFDLIIATQVRAAALPANTAHQCVRCCCLAYKHHSSRSRSLL